MSTVVELLDSLRDFYRSAAPVVLNLPRIAPATEAQLAAFESRLGFELPADYRTFLLRNDIPHSFSGNFGCMSVTEVVGTWAGMNELLDAGTFSGWVERKIEWGFENWDSGRLSKVWWSPRWVPFAQDGCGNLYCIDGEPGPAGVRYQVVNMEIQDGQGPYHSGFDSFVGYLRDHYDLLLDGKYTVEQWGIEVDRWSPGRADRAGQPGGDS